MLTLMKTQKDKMEADIRALRAAAQAREAQMAADAKHIEAQVERQVAATRARLETAARAHADQVAGIKAQLETQAERQVATIKARLEAEARALEADEIAAIQTQAETRARAQAERQAASMKAEMDAEMDAKLRAQAREIAAVKAKAQAEAEVVQDEKCFALGLNQYVHHSNLRAMPSSGVL